MDEIWQPIPGHSYYQASTEGRIRRAAGTPRASAPRLLTPRIRKFRPGLIAYRDVSLCNNGTAKSETVHKLVALAFLGPRPSPAHEVAHADGDPGNNRSSNLRWATNAENKEDYKRHGRTGRSAIGRSRDANGRFCRRGG